MLDQLETRLYLAEQELERFKEMRRLDILSGQYDQEAGEKELEELEDAVNQAEAALSEYLQPDPPIYKLVASTSHPEYKELK